VKKITIAVLLLTLATSLFAQKQKVGFVDTQVILSQYAPAIKANSDLTALGQKWKAQIDSMQQELKNGYAEYQKQSAMMKPEQQKQIQQNLIQKEQYMQQFNQQKFGQQGELAQKQDAMMQPIRDKIYQAIEKVSKTQKMQFIFDKAGDVLLLYADPQYDMTYKVLDLLKTMK